MSFLTLPNFQLVVLLDLWDTTVLVHLGHVVLALTVSIRVCEHRKRTPLAHVPLRLLCLLITLRAQT